MTSIRSVYDTFLRHIDGRETTLDEYAGKILLIVNVASKCGLTPQYAALQSLYLARHKQGLEILGFPANDFQNQEPGDDTEIMNFCTRAYNITFPMFSKVSVSGTAIHPLYAALTEARPQAVGDGPMRERLRGFGIDTPLPPNILWNFEKFLVGRDGLVIERFAPDVAADDPRLIERIDAALKTPASA